MKKVLGTGLVIAVSLVCAAPVVSARLGRYVEPEPLQGLADIAYTGEPCPATPPEAGELVHYADPALCWYGTVEGDITGTVAFWETDANYIAGKWMRFFEVMTIQPEAGGYINGIQRGTWSLKTGSFSTSGWVTSASAEWAYLIGYRYHEAGTTSDPNVLPLTGEDTAWKLSKPGPA